MCMYKDVGGVERGGVGLRLCSIACWTLYSYVCVCRPQLPLHHQWSQMEEEVTKHWLVIKVELWQATPSVATDWNFSGCLLVILIKR